MTTTTLLHNEVAQIEKRTHKLEDEIRTLKAKRVRLKNNAPIKTFLQSRNQTPYGC